MQYKTFSNKIKHNLEQLNVKKNTILYNNQIRLSQFQSSIVIDSFDPAHLIHLSVFVCVCPLKPGFAARECRYIVEWDRERAFEAAARVVSRTGERPLRAFCESFDCIEYSPRVYVCSCERVQYVSFAIYFNLFFFFALFFRGFEVERDVADLSSSNEMRWILNIIL